MQCGHLSGQVFRLVVNNNASTSISSIVPLEPTIGLDRTAWHPRKSRRYLDFKILTGKFARPAGGESHPAAYPRAVLRMIWVTRPRTCTRKAASALDPLRLQSILMPLLRGLCARVISDGFLTVASSCTASMFEFHLTSRSVDRSGTGGLDDSGKR